MEYGLRPMQQPQPMSQGRLNPCCNGIWSQTLNPLVKQMILAGLNPCCNGIWSQTRERESSFVFSLVLILVVMEYGLRLLEYVVSLDDVS